MFMRAHVHARRDLTIRASRISDSDGSHLLGERDLLARHLRNDLRHRPRFSGGGGEQKPPKLNYISSLVFVGMIHAAAIAQLAMKHRDVRLSHRESSLREYPTKTHAE